MGAIFRFFVMSIRVNGRGSVPLMASGWQLVMSQSIHSIQSVSTPITYAFALNRKGFEFTHSFLGAEAFGRPFNLLDLLPDQRPFNPCVNAGAIMTASIVASGSPVRLLEKILKILRSCGRIFVAKWRRPFSVMRR